MVCWRDNICRILTKEKAIELMEENVIDLAAFGRLLISNPDLPERFANDHPLSPGDRDRYYGFSAEGYIDYPTYQELSDADKKKLEENS